MQEREISEQAFFEDLFQSEQSPFGVIKNALRYYESSVNL